MDRFLPCSTVHYYVKLGCGGGQLITRPCTRVPCDRVRKNYLADFLLTTDQNTQISSTFNHRFERSRNLCVMTYTLIVFFLKPNKFVEIHLLYGRKVLCRAYREEVRFKMKRVFNSHYY
jgi:hypothetical protein